MKQETKDLYKKYMYFMFTVSNERNTLFNIDDHTIDYQKFFELCQYIQGTGGLDGPKNESRLFAGG